MNKAVMLLIILSIALGSCASDQSNGSLVYDTSFHAHFYGNLYRDESSVPEGFIDYHEYFQYAEAYFYLNGTCKFLMSEKNLDGGYSQTEETGTYIAEGPLPGRRLIAHYNNGRTATYTWEPNWHDPVSTPYELSEYRSMVLKATGETVSIVFSYASDYISEM